MPLIKADLKQSLESKIKDIEPKLKLVLDSKSDGLYKAQELSDGRIRALGVKTGFNINTYQRQVWTIISDEWSTVLAKEIMETLSKELSTIISDEMDKYIKSASIITPPGTLVVTAGSPTAHTGATSAPTAEAIIS